MSFGFLKMDSNLAPQNLVGQLELCISANSVGLYTQPLTRINSDLLAAQAMLPQPPPNTTDGFICLLSGPLDDFLKYSHQEQSKWLIDIAYDICDPTSLCGSLFVWNAGMQQWHLVTHTEPLTTSTYLYNWWSAIPDSAMAGPHHVLSHNPSQNLVHMFLNQFLTVFHRIFNVYNVYSSKYSIFSGNSELRVK